MSPADLAALHARCFTHPRPWSADEIAAIASLPGAFLLVRPRAFLIGRTAADEAELLTLAVDPGARRQGLGRALVQEFDAVAAMRGAARGFLEVASDNAAAQALYAAAGWARTGRRRGYYAPGIDALTMGKAIPQDAGGAPAT
ncbi:GNAT family N-acetyltransferase [Paracoccus aeridis]|uniref:GNAT family N-acetyltransferase n=1 Tax=Paracoccus aeridis TaxID=1966466 RepID=UPI0010AAFB10|nr:GNAT family N-acetyltransferase [Paracoccus aeridis]